MANPGIINLLPILICFAAAIDIINATPSKDEQYSKLNNPEDRTDGDDVTVDIFDSLKRKWSSKEMGMWGRKRFDPDAISKREWSSNKMGMWGRKKRAQIEDDDDDVIDDVSNYADWDSNDYPGDLDKRKWTSSNMGMWGKKRSQSSSPEQPRHVPVYVFSDHKRKWINQAAHQQRRSKWGSGKMMMWGKRSPINQDDTNENEYNAFAGDKERYK